MDHLQAERTLENGNEKQNICACFSLHEWEDIDFIYVLYIYFSRGSVARVANSYHDKKSRHDKKSVSKFG